MKIVLFAAAALLLFILIVRWNGRLTIGLDHAYFGGKLMGFTISWMEYSMKEDWPHGRNVAIYWKSVHWRKPPKRNSEGG